MSSPLVPDLTLDSKNANRGTVRGKGMVERSLQQYGAGRSILVDRHGVAIAGNKTLETARELGIPVQVIESDGRTLYAIKRTDLDIEKDTAAKELGIADNRSSEVGLEWDANALTELVDDGVDLEQFWFEGPELDRVLGNIEDGDVDPSAEWNGMPEFEMEDRDAVKKITVNFLSEADVGRFARLVEQNVTMSTRSIWYPAVKREVLIDRGYVLDETHDES